MHDVRLHAFIGDCLTAKQNIPDLHTTIGFSAARLCTSSGDLRLLAFAAKVSTSSGVKLLR